jgi:hypothetical protein
MDPVSLLVEAPVLMALAEVVVAAVPVGLEDALGGWMMFEGRNAAAVDEKAAVCGEEMVIKR